MAHDDVSSEAVDHLRFVSRSPVRVRFLLALADDGPSTRRDLRQTVDASRTTVSRNLDALVERGWVEESGATYRATPGGELLASELRELLSTTATVDRLGPFFRWFPVDELDVEWEWFADAGVYASTSSDPYAPIDRHVERIETAADLRCLLPQVGLRAMRALGRERDGFEHELVVSPSVGETLRSEEKYVEGRAAVSERGRLDVYVADRPVPVYLGLFDDCVQVGVSDGDGVPRALVETDDERVREWAGDLYERHRSEATPL